MNTLETMLTIRRFEETVVGLFGAGEFMTHTTSTSARRPPGWH